VQVVEAARRFPDIQDEYGNVESSCGTVTLPVRRLFAFNWEGAIGLRGVSSGRSSSRPPLRFFVAWADTVSDVAWRRSRPPLPFRGLTD
jgi:hypothetical protein